jgi:hypothetical protein
MDSLKQLIIKYCEAKGGWVYGGQIEDMIRSEYGNKASNASRRCRELVNSGILEKSLVQIDGKGPRIVQYRIEVNPLIENDLVLNPPQEIPGFEGTLEQTEKLNL